MGTWGTGPFDNDTAADFAGDLDDAPPGEREAHVRGVLARTVSAAGYLDVAQEAVAAAALIAAQCPGGRPVETVYGPEQPLRCSLKTSGNWPPGPWTGSWPAGRGLRCGSALLTRPSGWQRSRLCGMYSALGRLHPMSRCLVFKPRRQRAVLPAADSQARPQPPAARPLRANKTSDPAANCGQNTYERSHPAVDLTTSPP